MVFVAFQEFLKKCFCHIKTLSQPTLPSYTIPAFDRRTIKKQQHCSDGSFSVWLLNAGTKQQSQKEIIALVNTFCCTATFGLLQTE